MNSFRRITAPNGVTYLRSGLLASPHGFSTRIGGVSREAHTASMNLGFGRGDEDETVLENLRLFSEAVGIDPHTVISRPQIHSPVVFYADESMAGEGYYQPAQAEGDGYVTDRRGITLGVKTADCVPILFEDAGAGIIGAVHAGWRGTAAGIAAKCVEKMQKLGADPARITAAIGPSIRFCCYEVGEDFYEAVSRMAGAGMASAFIRKSEGEARLHADLVGMNVRFLLEAGLRKEGIDIAGECTCCHPELFHSHRALHGKRGTLLSVIALKP